MGLDDGPAEIQPQTIMVRIAKPGFIDLVKGLKNHIPVSYTHLTLPTTLTV